MSEYNPSSVLQVSVHENILLVALNRPDKRNAINEETILAIEEIFSNIPEGVKCAIVFGNGKHFSAGLDLSEIVSQEIGQSVLHSRMWHRVFDKIQFGTVPVIAVIHGACVGGGLELASACHVRIGDRSSYFALPEGQRGIFVGGSGSVRISKLIGAARMTDMMLTGRVLDAVDGERHGIIQYMVDEGKGLEKGIELAKKISSNAGMTNYALMHVLPRIIESGQDSGLMMESLMAAIAQESPEAKQRLQDFLQGKAKKVTKNEEY